MSRRGHRTSCWGPMSIGSRAWARAENGGEDRPEAPSEERRRGEQERGAEWEMSPWGEEERWPWVVRVKGMTEFRQPLQVQSHLEVPRILVQLGHIQRT